MYLAHGLDYLTQKLKRLAAVLTLGLFAFQSFGLPVIAQGVVISEFMPNPIVIDDATGEWIELRNLTNTAQDISGWQLVVDGTPIDIPAPTTISPQGYYVICRTMANVDVPCNLAASFSLANSGTRTITLKNGAETVDTATVDATATTPETIDEVTYTNSTAGNSTVVNRDSAGNPVLTKDNVNSYSTDGSNTDYGTPGGVNFDTINPTVNINNPVDGSNITTNSFDVTGTASDYQSGLKTAELLINGTSIDTVDLEAYDDDFAFNGIALLHSGSYTIKVVVSDHKGNTSEAEHTITIVNDATITINNDETNDNTPELSGSITSAAARVVVTVNGIPYNATNNGDGTWVLADNIVTTLDDGIYTVVAHAEDNIGASISSNTGTLLIDTTAPKITVDKLTTSSHSPTLTGTVDDPDATVRITVRNKTYFATNHGERWSLSGHKLVPSNIYGNFDVKAEAEDALGNIGTDETTDELQVVSLLTSATTHARSVAASFVAAVTSGNADEIDSDGDGIPDSQDDTPFGEEEDSQKKNDSKDDKDNAASKDKSNDSTWRWVIFGIATIAFLWFMFKGRTPEES